MGTIIIRFDDLVIKSQEKSSKGLKGIDTLRKSKFFALTATHKPSTIRNF